jgi:hypothetical protein
MNQPWIKITYTTPDNELSRAEKAVREQLETTINDAVEQFHHESTPGHDGLVEIELYPCDEDNDVRKLVAAEAAL